MSWYTCESVATRNNCCGVSASWRLGILKLWGICCFVFVVHCPPTLMSIYQVLSQNIQTRSVVSAVLDGLM